MTPAIALLILLIAAGWIFYLALTGIEAGRKLDIDLPLLLDDHDHNWQPQGNRWVCTTCGDCTPRTTITLEEDK